MAKKINTKDLYKILGISPNASLDDVEKAYKELTKEEDLKKDKTQEQNLENIRNAYKTLSDPQKRKDYDEQLRNKLNNPELTQEPLLQKKNQETPNLKPKNPEQIRDNSQQAIPGQGGKVKIVAAPRPTPTPINQDPNQIKLNQKVKMTTPPPTNNPSAKKNLDAQKQTITNVENIKAANLQQANTRKANITTNIIKKSDNKDDLNTNKADTNKAMNLKKEQIKENMEPPANNSSYRKPKGP